MYRPFPTEKTGTAESSDDASQLVCEQTIAMPKHAAYVLLSSDSLGGVSREEFVEGPCVGRSLSDVWSK